MPKPQKRTDMLFVRTVAKRLHCSDQHVYNLIKSGKLEAIRLGARALRISEASLSRFIEDQKVDVEEYYV